MKCKFNIVLCLHNSTFMQKKRKISRHHEARLVRQGKVQTIFSAALQNILKQQSNENSSQSKPDAQDEINDHCACDDDMSSMPAQCANKSPQSDEINLFQYVNAQVKNVLATTSEDETFKIPNMYTPISSQSNVTNLLFILTLAHIMFQRK